VRNLALLNVFNKVQAMGMSQVVVNNTVPVSAFKKSPNKFIEAARGEAVAVMTGSKASFYAVPARLFELLVELSEDRALNMMVGERLAEPYSPIPYEPEE
jgi:hypothetical protein